jgi:hypothetical protein
MAMTITAERRLLTDAEFEAVSAAHYLDICALPKGELIVLARRLRE